MRDEQQATGTTAPSLAEAVPGRNRTWNPLSWKNLCVANACRRRQRRRERRRLLIARVPRAAPAPRPHTAAPATDRKHDSPRPLRHSSAFLSNILAGCSDTLAQSCPGECWPRQRQARRGRARAPARPRPRPSLGIRSSRGPADPPSAPLAARSRAQRLACPHRPRPAPPRPPARPGRSGHQAVADALDGRDGVGPHAQVDLLAQELQAAGKGKGVGVGGRGG